MNCDLTSQIIESELYIVASFYITGMFTGLMGRGKLTLVMS